MSVFVTGGQAAPGINYVEWIESSGTQYINTGFKANNNTRVVMDFTYKAGDVVFGAYDTNGADGYGIQYAGAKWYYYYGTGSAYTSSAASAGTRYRFDCNKNVVSMNGAVIHTATANTFQGDNPLLLFAIQNAGNPGFYTSLTLYSCQIYDNGMLIRDFRPCYDPGGVACLYDKVSKTYFYNSGSGSFAAGGAA